MTEAPPDDVPGPAGIRDAVLGTVGDLLEDVVVELRGPIRPAADTAAVVTRRRGGSAANVAVVAARLEGRSAFIGNVGTDPLGDRLVADLHTAGVRTSVTRSGRTGTVVAIVDQRGERTMLTDRGAATDLTDVDASAVGGLHSLHVPMYSLDAPPIAVTSERLIAQARSLGTRISIDASSTSTISGLGVEQFNAILDRIHPDVFVCNLDEALLLDLDRPAGSSAIPHWRRSTMIVVKRGADPATVTVGDQSWDVPAAGVREGADSTGAGDAFAAGLLVALNLGATPPAATAAAHRAAIDWMGRSLS